MFEDPDAIARLAYLVLLLTGLWWFGFASRRRGTFRQAAIWVLIFAAVIAGYALVPGR